MIIYYHIVSFFLKAISLLNNILYLETVLENRIHILDIKVVRNGFGKPYSYIRYKGGHWLGFQFNVICSAVSLDNNQVMANKKDEVYMRPSEIRYSQISILNTFKDGTLIGELLDDLYFGRCSTSAIKLIEVTQVNGQWYSADNRRLWVFKTVESVGKLERVQVKVKKRTPQGKMTTKDNGQTIRIRGGDPGGQVWEAIQELEKENAPKKRKRKKNRRKKKSKQVDDASKASGACETVDIPDISDTQASENTETCDNVTDNVETDVASLIFFATLQELNDMLQNMKSFGQLHVEAPQEGVICDPNDESVQQRVGDRGDTEDTEDTQEFGNGETEVLNVSMFKNSGDEKSSESIVQTTLSPTYIHTCSHNIKTLSSNGVSIVHSENNVSDVPEPSRNVTNEVHYRTPGVQLIQPQCGQNEPITQQQRENGYSSLQPCKNVDLQLHNDTCSNKETLLQWMEDKWRLLRTDG